MSDYALRFPIGDYTKPDNYTPEELKTWISNIVNFPAKLAAEVHGLTETDLQKCYRPGGWNIRQVVHHCADSHINMYVRFKLSLTEDNPVIKPYIEDLWAKLPDTSHTPIDVSVNILLGVHKRWEILVQNLNPDDFNRGYFHPEKQRIVPLWEAVALYSWHSNHHLEHVRVAKRN